eukprot:GHRR01033616.1.p1 GENE.GHRR01033616.1~~GHRR01033616.1.p1  ORF type:complete len:210 (-),score=24.21 GHRR01033616.1:116-703(-)
MLASKRLTGNACKTCVSLGCNARVMPVRASMCMRQGVVTPQSSPSRSPRLIGSTRLRPGVSGRRASVQTRAFFNQIFKQDPAEKTRRQYQDRVDVINALEPAMQAMSDDQLRAKTQEFKRRVQNGQSLDSILPEAFAVVREASRRVLGLRPFDVQLIGGMILHEGQIAEMRTGKRLSMQLVSTKQPTTAHMHLSY